MNSFTTWPQTILVPILAVVFSAAGASASCREDIDPGGDKDHNRSEHGSLGNIGHKLADPTSNIWALFFNIQAATFSDGDLNTGNPRMGGNVLFEPILPFPLYGTGENQWRMITRPVIPIIFAQQIPEGFDDFKHIGGS